MLDSMITVDGYEMDNTLYHFLLDYLTDIERRHIINIINELCSINECDIVYFKFDPNLLEEVILDVINKNKDESSDNIRILVLEAFRSYIVDYIGKLGFFLNLEISLKELLQFISSMHTIINPDKVLADNLLYMLEDSENETEVIFSNMLAEYTTLSGLELYELIEAIDPRLVNTLTAYYSTLTEQTDVSNIEQDVVEVLNTLIEIEPKYIHTKAYKIVLETGDLIENFLPYINTLYNVINSVGEEYLTLEKELPVFKMVLEITAFLYLSKDTRDIIPDACKTYIHLDSIKAFREIPKALNIAEELLKKNIEDLEIKG